MKILIGLTYYRPHYSGLTIYTERLAKSLAKLGHSVTVLTSRFAPELAAREVCDGVQVIRPEVLMHLSKGVIMPAMPSYAARLIREADVVNLHLPQMDAGYMAWMARISRKPVVMTYHCDLHLPSGVVNWVANKGSSVFSHAAALAADAIVTNTRDYAEHSRFLRRYLRKTRYISTPVELPEVTDADVQRFRAAYNLRPGQPVIGMCGRLATEKGVEYLIEALPAVIERFPTVRMLHLGQYQNLLGEEQYARKLAPMIERLGQHWTFLGVLPPLEQAAFYRACDVTVLPSINQTESFGMVQVESMIAGTPVVASDMPGVRCAVLESSMGRIAAPRSGAALAEALIEILSNPQQYAGDPSAVRARYASETIARQYLALFEELQRNQ